MHSKTHITAARYAAIRTSAIRLGRQADLMEMMQKHWPGNGWDPSDVAAVAAPLHAAADLLAPGGDDPPRPAECLAILAEGWGRLMDYYARNLGEILAMHDAPAREAECIAHHAQVRSEFQAHLRRQPLQPASASAAHEHALCAFRLYADQLQALAMGFRAAQLANDAIERRLDEEYAQEGWVRSRSGPAWGGIDARCADAIDKARRAAVCKLDAATASAAVLMRHRLIV